MFGWSSVVMALFYRMLVVMIVSLCCDGGRTAEGTVSALVGRCDAVPTSQQLQCGAAQCLPCPWYRFCGLRGSISRCEERHASGSCWQGRFGSWCLRSCRLVFFNAALGELWACSDCALSWWIPSCGKWCSSPVKCCMTQQPCRYCDRCGTDVGPTAAYCHGQGGVVLGACCEVAEGWYDVTSLEGDIMPV